MPKLHSPYWNSLHVQIQLNEWVATSYLELKKCIVGIKLMGLPKPLREQYPQSEWCPRDSSSQLLQHLWRKATHFFACHRELTSLLGHPLQSTDGITCRNISPIWGGPSVRCWAWGGACLLQPAPCPAAHRGGGGDDAIFPGPLLVMSPSPHFPVF